MHTALAYLKPQFFPCLDMVSLWYLTGSCLMATAKFIAGLGRNPLS